MDRQITADGTPRVPATNADGLRSGSATFGPALLLLAAGWVAVALLNPADHSDQHPEFAFGAVYGTLFGQTLLAAGWTMLGLGSVSRRLTVSAAWLCVLFAAAAINSARYDHPADVAFAVVSTAGFLFGIWLLALLPLWLLRVATGVRLRHRDRPPVKAELPGRFRLWELLVAMLATALFLTLVRAAVLGSIDQAGMMMLLIIFASAGLFSLILALPLALCVFLDRHAVPMTLTVLAFNLVIPQVLVLGAVLLIGPEARGYIQLLWPHGFALAWILVITGLLRGGGYLLLPARPMTPP